MFRKLVSNLPFNPSLIGNISFYAKRVKQEESLRRIGFGFVALAMFIQMFAVIAPPEPTIAASDNDIIRGGFTNKDQAILHCINPESDFNTILSSLGITCEDIGNSRTETISSTDYSGELYSMGRQARGPVGKNNKPTEEYSVQAGTGTYYMRKLNSFDTGSSSSYRALVGTSASGKHFMILFNCGNPVIVGRGQTPPPEKAPPQETPTPAPVATPVDDSACEVTAIPSSVKRGESFTATIRVKNTGTTSWNPSAGYMLGSESPRDNMNWGKNRVNLTSNVNPGSSLDIQSSFTAPSSPGTYQFSWQMLQSGVKWFGVSCSKPVSITIPDTPPVDVCPEISGNQKSPAECAPCEDSTNDKDVQSCLLFTKTASNRTQSLEDANNTTANPGDEITYTLSVTNRGKISLNNFNFQESIVDILEYSELKDYSGASISEDQKTLSWGTVSIDPGRTEQKTFTVKVKSTIPETPRSSSDPTSYDLTMTNVFNGVTVNIHLPPGIGKTTEQVVTTLPSTGPGTSVAIGFLLISVVGYFFARSRLISKELEIIRTDFAQTGGI